MTKFSNVNLIQKMSEITDAVVKHYKTDLNYDINALQELNINNKPDEFHFIWIARESGTHLIRENELFHRDSEAQYIYKNTHKGKYFVIDVKDIDGNGVSGNIYPIDPGYYDKLIDRDYPVVTVDLEFKSGHKQTYDYDYYDSYKYRISHENGEIVGIRYNPSASDKEMLDIWLFSLRHGRNTRALEGDFNHFLKTLERSVER